MNNLSLSRKLLILLAGAMALAALAFLIVTQAQEASRKILTKTWAGYKYYFIAEDGRVKRPKDQDTVSEGQAYAMLRAVWMNDRAVFDRCYQWTEGHLSRRTEKGDNLLAWHWQNGRVADWMPASDADIDYALSLILAERKWGTATPAGLEPYGDKARKILQDVLRQLTRRTASGRVYLVPWILEGRQPRQLPINPSYYSPAHFRIFYEFTKDETWLKLVDTTYFLMNTLAQEFDHQPGRGLIPDWCSVDEKDQFAPLPNKNSGFGWESVRVPFRLALDYYWFAAKEAQACCATLSRFIEQEEQRHHALFCAYRYDGTIVEPKYESALFYAAYATALRVSGSPHAEELLKKVRACLVKNDQRWVYQDTQDYYVNSLSWLAEAFSIKSQSKH